MRFVLTFPDANAAASAPPGDYRATCDPNGFRLGSGGGTLAALDEDRDGGEDIEVIIHAGGASSRCPTQMVLGKAWTTLPSSDGLTTTPVEQWITLCRRLFCSLPNGSVVVVAADCLLSLPDEVCLPSNIDDTLVIGVSVPAPLNVAKNHGVYVLDGKSDLSICSKILQKPTIDELRHSYHAETAWIDTGIIAFLPEAAKALRRLRAIVSPSWSPGASSRPPSLDLYTHFLQALDLQSCQVSKQTYMERYDEEVSSSVLEAVYDSLSPHRLAVWAIKNGEFLHLGTTRELQDYVLRFPGVYDALSLTECHDSCVVLESLVEEVVRLEPCTVVEHSQLVHECSIGSDCLISGLREQTDTFAVPSSTFVQQLTMGNETVFMVLGLDDQIKTLATLYGRTIDEFFRRTKVIESDIWDSNGKRTLWNAKLHPVGKTSFVAVFGWLLDYCTTSTLIEDSSLDTWKSCCRVSLAQIRQEANATVEFEQRRTLKAISICERRQRYGSEVSDALLNRCNLEIRQSLPFEELVHILETAKQLDLPDVCVRVCHLILHMLRDLKTSKKQTALRRRTDPNSTDIVPTKESFEKEANDFTKKCVETLVKNPFEPRLSFDQNVLVNKWVIASSPSRIDFAGGWSDTPPICFEYGSSVVGAAVAVDGMRPLSCRCRLVSDGFGILLRTEQRDLARGNLIDSNEVFLSSTNDMAGWNDPNTPCALLMCSLVCMGIISKIDTMSEASKDLQPILNKLCPTADSVGLEVIATSLLPRGSGLGTSSILGGCVLATLGKCLGNESIEGEIVNGVLLLEQLLTTGGGFQDQVNGLVGGVKLATCSSFNNPPPTLKVQQLQIPREALESLSSRLWLVFTGQTRLAKNILSSVLSRWSLRTAEVMVTVAELLSGAQEAQKALVAGDINQLALCLNDYWRLKKLMAGDDSGVEPPHVAKAMEELRSSNLIDAVSLCGAGGGGFMVVLTSSKTTVIETLQSSVSSANNFTWHSCNVDQKGLTINTVTGDFERDYYDIEWHR